MPSLKERPRLAAIKNKLFLSHIRNTAARQALTEGLVGSTSVYSLLNTVPDEVIVHVCEDAGAADDPEAPDVVAEVAPAAVGAGPGAIIALVVQMILNMDPAVKKKIVDTILKLIGLKD